MDETWIRERLSPTYDVWIEEASSPQPAIPEVAGEVVSTSVNLALFIATPFILLADWLRAGKRAPGEPPEWESLGEIGNRKVWNQTLMNNEDFPAGLDLYADPAEVYLLFRFRFAPAVPQLESLYFFEETLTTESGMYLLSYNSPGEGMTVWFLGHEADQAEAIAKVEAREWELEGEPGGGLRLEPLDDEQGKAIMIFPRGFTQ